MHLDLHLHSTYSDGALTPSELVATVAASGVRVLSLTDHDNVDGIDEARAAAEPLGVEVVSGVEFSVQWEQLQDVHLLGYGFDHHHPALTGALQEFRAYREGRNARILQKINGRLADAGLPLLDEERARSRVSGTYGRPHIARELLEAGVVRSMDEAFTRFLVPCNEPKRFFPVLEAINLISEAGGCAVLAHPHLIKASRTTIKRMIEELLAVGLDGIEGFYPSMFHADHDWFYSVAVQNRLVVTGGTDFHGNEFFSYADTVASFKKRPPESLMYAFRGCCGRKR